MTQVTRLQLPDAMHVNAVIFDMDGLLIDSERIALRVFQQTCDDYKLGDQFALYAKLLGTNETTTREILDRTLPSIVDNDEFMQLWAERYVAETVKPVPLMKGVNNLLDHLEENNIDKAVATSTATQHAIEKLEKAGIRSRFTTITGGDQVSNGKPAPDIYQKAASSIGVAAEHCLALEDSPNGVRAALGANMQVIQIPQLVEPDSETRALGHFILDDLDAVISMLIAGSIR